MDILDIARFWNAVDVRNRKECWFWKKRRDGNGHGEFKVDGRSSVAHRVAFELAYGQIPDGMLVRHTCDNGACCNPTHLLTGTHADNVRDRVIRQRGAIGENAGRAKLTNDQVYAIRESELARDSLARMYGVSIHNISAIRSRRSWKHLPELEATRVTSPPTPKV
jgi:hypothetical protein